MKKKIIYTLAATMAVTGAVQIVSMPVSAKSVAQDVSQSTNKPVEIKTAQDFIDTYCSLSKIDSKGNITNEKVLITALTQKNYQGVLSGKVVYDTLSKEMQAEIDTLLSEQLQAEALKLKMQPLYKSFPEMAAAALKIDMELYPEKYSAQDDSNNENTENPSDEVEDTSNPGQGETGADNSLTDDSQNDKTDVEDDSKDNDNQTDKNEDDNNSESTTDDETKDPVKDKEDSFTDEETEDPVDESKDENSEAAYPIVGLTPGKKETEKKSVEEPVSILAALEKPTVVVETPATESKQETVNLETVSTTLPTQTTTTSTEAQNFIDTYLTSSAGNVYTQANSLNYRNILNGLSIWNKFTAATRSDVNAILKTRVGKTYQTLLKEAQTIQFNGVSQTVAGGSINTATQSNAGLYGALMGLSVGLFGLFFKKKKEHN